jgi:hypothetical protein
LICVKSKKSKDYRSVLDNIFRIYHAAGFKVVKIHCDKEFEPLKNQLQDELKVFSTAPAQKNTSQRPNETAGLWKNGSVLLFTICPTRAFHAL